MNNDLISREDLKKSMRKSINERYISWTKTITVADIATLIFDEIEYAPTIETSYDLYREETCERKAHCYDYQYWHCIGCNGCKADMRGGRQ